MTWAQTITIVVPLLIAIIGGIFYGNKQTDLLARMIADLRGDMNARFVTIDGRLIAFEGRFGQIEGRFDRIEGRFGLIEGRFDRIEGRFDRIESRVDRLEAKLDSRFEKLELLLLDILKPRAS